MIILACENYYKNYIVKIIEVYHIPKRLPKKMLCTNTSNIKSFSAIINHIQKLDDNEIIDIILDTDPEFSWSESTNRNELIGIYIMILNDCFTQTKDVFDWSCDYESDY